MIEVPELGTLNVRRRKGDRLAFTGRELDRDRKSTRLNSSHLGISYAVFCLKKTTSHDASIAAAPPPRQRARTDRDDIYTIPAVTPFSLLTPDFVFFF